ncbi:LOW QUALITY PROTEIN: extracellular matrix protein 2 [Monodelphis domestica]|uniref:LOW QUALITY PROTEIN: extracellular matrix protein 2 n=1 Tax=Monodelphis domestica TaxID=13616 RepID=UPI0024E22580|nr:LOW QUALITY PROTEIN: extracellular matrix protein 2 [Monodelphis domestica]
MKLPDGICCFLLMGLYIDLAQNGLAGTLSRQSRRRGHRALRKAPSLNRRAHGQSEPLVAATPKQQLPLRAPEGSAVDLVVPLASSLGEESGYNVLPGRKGRCAFGGIVMYDGAVWSPEPCVTCLCSGGTAVCDEATCPPRRCPRPVTPAGECCPLCPDAGGSPELPGDALTQRQEVLQRKEQEAGEEDLRRQGREKVPKRKGKGRRPRPQSRLEERPPGARGERATQMSAGPKSQRRCRRGSGRRRRNTSRDRGDKEEDDDHDDHDDHEDHEDQDHYYDHDHNDDDDHDDDHDHNDDHDDDDDHYEVPYSPVSEPDTEAPPVPRACTIWEHEMSCTNANLTQVPIISDPDLRSLELIGNSIRRIPDGAFLGTPNLETLDLRRNAITASGISPNVFKPLKKLTCLYLDGNGLVRLPPALPSGLLELKVNENALRSLDEDSLAGLKHLVTLELEGNELSESNVSPWAFGPLQRLSYLRLGRNRFRIIPQGLPTSIEELYLESNQIEEIKETSFNHTRNINVIVLSHNKIEENRIDPLAWIHHKNLESVDLSYNKLYHVPSYLPKSLLHLVLVGNQIERIPGYVFGHMKPGLEYLYLSFNRLRDDGVHPVSFFGAYHSLREVFLDHNELQAVPFGISRMTSLHLLRLNNNKIRNVLPQRVCRAKGRDSPLEQLHLENNYIRLRDLPLHLFSCLRSYASIVLRPQKAK